MSARIRAPSASYRRRWSLNATCLALSDAMALTTTLFVAGVLRLWVVDGEVTRVPGEIVLAVPVWWMGSALTSLLPGWGCGPVEELRRLTQLLCVLYGGIVGTLYLLGSSQSGAYLTMGGAFLLSLWAVPYGRLLCRRGLIRCDWWGIPTAVYGAGPMGRRVVRLLRKEKGLGYNPVVMFDDDPTQWGRDVDTVQVLGSTELVMPRVPVAVLATPELRPERLRTLLEGPLDHYRSTLVIPSLFEVPSLWVRPRDLSGLLGLEVTNNLSSLQARALKRALDLVLVGTTAPLWIPVCAIIALLIWWEDGLSPFFVQKRVGAGGETIHVVKFRTMVADAEAVLRRHLERDEALRREWERAYKLKHDPRITGVGTVLRRFSLDELPQLWNVLRGEMSLVGPRPLPMYHQDALTDRACTLRERVRPGLTGLWQISGRSDSGTHGMEKYDPYYVRNWSLWLDAVILIRTLRTVMMGRGAY